MESNPVLSDVGVVSRVDSRISFTIIDDGRSSRKRLTIDCSHDGRTEQCHTSECEIGAIMRKYEKTGLISHTANVSADYRDVSGAEDYLSSMTKVMNANAAFATLSSRLRLKFDNDPSKFVEYINNADNLDEMIELGLVEPKKVIKEPIKADSVKDKPKAKSD